MPNYKKQNLWRGILISFLIAIIFASILEGTARLFLYFTRGSSTVGMPEKTLYLTYQPYVMFGPDYDMELSPYKYLKTKDNIQEYRILLLGGSTAANFPSGILEQVFQNKFPNYRFKVINAASGGYNARQELIVAAIWGPSIEPHMIISLDGANDLLHRLRMKKAGAFYLNSTYKLAIVKPVLFILGQFVNKSQAVNGINRFLEHQNIGSTNDYMDAIFVYIKAQHSINVIARGLPAVRIMALQPFMSFKEPLSKEEANFKIYSYRESIMMELYDSLNEELIALARKDDVKYIDTRPAFNRIERTIFSDDVHFVNNAGYRMLAEYIVKAISKEDLISTY